MAFPYIHHDRDCDLFFFVWLALGTFAMIPLTFWGCVMENRYAKAKNRKKCHCGDCIRKNRRLALRNILEFVLYRCLCGGFVATLILLAPQFACKDLKEIKQKPFKEIRLPDKIQGGNGVFMALAETYKAFATAIGWKHIDQDVHTQVVAETITFGIALPAFLLSVEYRLWYLGIYGVVLFVALPLGVSYWWHGAMRYTGKILTATIEQQHNLLRSNNHLDVRRALMLLSYSFEFNRDYNSKMMIRNSDNQVLRDVFSHWKTFEFETMECPLFLKYSIKARTILQAHFSRLCLKPATLERDRLLIVRLSVPLVEGLLAHLTEGTQPPYCDTESFENAIKLLPMIVQAVGERTSPLLQLPHVTEQQVRSMMWKRQDLICNTLQRFASLRSRDRRSLLRPLNDSEYKNAMTVLGGMPLIDVAVSYEVLDDKNGYVVTPGATVTATIKINRQDMRTLFNTIVEAIQLEEDPAPGDRPAAAWCRRSLRRRAGRGNNAPGEAQGNVDDDEEWKRLQSEYKVKPPILFPSKESHEVHCPLFTDKKQEYWWLYICDRATHSIITKPYQIMDLVRFKKIKLQFAVPLKPGVFTFAVCLRSDSYLGVDHCQELKLKIKERPAIQLENPQYRGMKEDTAEEAPSKPGAGEASSKSGAEVESAEDIDTDVYYDTNDGDDVDDHFTPE